MRAAALEGPKQRMPTRFEGFRVSYTRDCDYSMSKNGLTGLEVTLDTVDEGSLRTGDNKVDTVLLGESKETGVVIALDIDALDLAVGTLSGASIAGSDVDNVDAGRLGQFPSQRMFTAAIADDENAQPFRSHGERCRVL